MWLFIYSSFMKILTLFRIYNMIVLKEIFGKIEIFSEFYFLNTLRGYLKKKFEIYTILYE